MAISPSVDWGQTSVSARYLAEHRGPLSVAHVVMSAPCHVWQSYECLVTLIGHTPTVTIHNRHPHLALLVTSIVFTWLNIVTIIHFQWARTPHYRRWFSSLGHHEGEGGSREWSGAWWWPTPTRRIIHYATLYYPHPFAGKLSLDLLLHSALGLHPIWLCSTTSKFQLYFLSSFSPDLGCWFVILKRKPPKFFLPQSLSSWVIDKASKVPNPA